MKRRRFCYILCTAALCLALLAGLTACQNAPVVGAGGSAGGELPPGHTLPPLPGAAQDPSGQDPSGQDPSGRDPSGPSTPEPSAQETPAPAPRSTQPIPYSHAQGAFSIDLPPDFEVLEEAKNSMYAARKDHSILCVGYNTCDMDIPMYSCDDLGDNRGYCAARLWENYGATAYAIDKAEYTSVGQQRAYRVDCTLELSGERASGFILGVDAPGFGCYLLFGSYYPDDPGGDMTAKEMEAAIASFRSTGTPNNGTALFESDELGLRAIYPVAYCQGGAEVVYDQQDEGLVDCVYFYLHSNRATMNYVEAERAVYGSTPQKAMDALHARMKKAPGLLELSTQEEGELGLRRYLVRTYSVMTDDGGTVYITMATMEIDGTVIAVGGIANEEGFDDTTVLFTSVLQTVQPYDPDQSLL